MNHLDLRTLLGLGKVGIEMKKLVLTIWFTLLASPLGATTYYLAPASAGGNDSNNGTSASTPWLTPKHAVSCGDVILAASSTAYAQASFAYGNWGTVTCQGVNNVAWLRCVTFDACKMSITSKDGFDVDNSYWGIQGFEVDGTSASGPCFNVYPSRAVTIHHIIFANNVAIGCGLNGFDSGSNGTSGVDYFSVIGNIAQNAAGGSTYCGSGISVFEPVASDSLPGTHLYIAGNFTWDNVDGNPCNGGAPTDGEGIILDSFAALSYVQQTVVDNNLSFMNGAKGIHTFHNNGSPSASVYYRHNTAYGNNTASSVNLALCAEFMIDGSYGVQAFYNLAQTTSATACRNHTLYDFQVNNGNGTDSVYNNYSYGAAENDVGITGSSVFSSGPSNVFGTTPGFSNPVDPGVPNCGNASSVPNCMATVVSNFTPTVAAAMAYGYQIPSTSQTYDPLFPRWLCNVNLPPGLVTIGCLSASNLPATVTITNVTVR